MENRQGVGRCKSDFAFEGRIAYMRNFARAYTIFTEWE